MKAITVCALLLCSVGLLQAQDSLQADVFTVKKVSDKPIKLQLIGSDTCIVGKLYFISRPTSLPNGKDSISIYKMTFKQTVNDKGLPYYLFSKGEEGTGYFVIWTRNKKTGEFKQSYVKPIYFLNPTLQIQ